MDLKIETGSLSTSRRSVVVGAVSQLGYPISREVRAYSRSNGILLASTKSGNNGKYKMYLPDDVAYTIVAIDKNKQYNAVIQDNVVPK